MRKTRSDTPVPKKPTDVFKQRLQYVCELLFGGKYTKFAEAVGYERSVRWFGKVVYYDANITAKTLAKLIQSGLINAEYLMCGTGPACDPPKADAPGRLTLADKFQTEFECFDTTTVQFAAPIIRTPPEPKSTDCLPLSLAQAIHAARGADKPVIVSLNEAAMLEGISPVIAQLIRKRYVTMLACTSGAAYRDLEYARHGGFNVPVFDNQFIDINEAALLAANNGLGYGEAIGRWCFSKGDNRKTSAIATAYELGVPVVVQATIGDSPNHWFPSKRGAELGAAIGAASYTDMLIFAEQLRQCAGTEYGVFIPTDQTGIEFFNFAKQALESDARTADIHVMTCLDMISISGEHRRTFPALLAACDAVYDGSADNGTRPCRVRRN